MVSTSDGTNNRYWINNVAQSWEAHRTECQLEAWNKNKSR
jgi:hypothetical protein